jgi:hypothetical protein
MAESARNPDVERRINEHLEAIDKHLAAKGVPLTERRSVTGDVEAQIRDMLVGNTGNTPAVADVENILRKLDAPESYAEDAEAEPFEKQSLAEDAVPPRFSRTVIVGAAWAPLFFFLFFLFSVHRVSHVSGQPPAGPSALQTMARFTLLPLGFCAPFGTTVLGWIAVGRIRRSNGRLYGLGLAFAEGLIFPLLLLDGLIYLFWRVVIAVAISWKSLGMDALGRPSYSMADENKMLIFVLAAATALVIDWLIVRWAWRRVNVSKNRSATVDAG